MSNSTRIELRENYMQGWYQMDLGRLMSTTAPGFIFDDPVEPEPVTRAELAGYMQRWDTRMRALGGNNKWRLSHQMREDRDGVLTDWEWWEVIDTGMQGAAVIVVGDEGVLLERITYFDRGLRSVEASSRKPG